MLVDRIRALCSQKGTTLAELERVLGFANGSLGKSDGKIQSVRLKAIADYFGVSMEYLLEGEQPGKPVRIISDFEYQIILKYRQLSSTEQSMLLRSIGLEEKKGQDALEDGA